jgi:hypothetical protein
VNQVNNVKGITLGYMDVPVEMLERLVKFYNWMKRGINEVSDQGEWAEQIRFEEIDNGRFFMEYVWVVINSGFRYRVAKMIYDKWKNTPNDFSMIRHPLKRRALEIGFREFPKWFEELKTKKTDQEKIEYLETLPHIGKITKYHLARNIGIDCAKPDRHLVRLAMEFGFENNDEVHVQEMCKYISGITGDRIGKVDVILWQFCELFPDYLKQIYTFDK